MRGAPLSSPTHNRAFNFSSLHPFSHRLSMEAGRRPEKSPAEDEAESGGREDSKKLRGAAAGAAFHQPFCQVERCTADATEAKRYHRRHKVCDAHSKSPAVVVAGLPQRFCQQCSRFHELSEFDDTKRSCRRRLAGHNERRRKGASDSRGEGSNRCGQGDEGGRIPIIQPGNSPSYKHFHIR